MRLYLVRHGRAKHSMEDPRRPLNQEGIEEVQRVAVLLNQNHECPEAIWHSPKTRAVETAQILAEQLGCEHLRLFDDLNPEDPLAPLLAELENLTRSGELSSLMLVGHLPYMGLLCSALLCGNEQGMVVQFSEATIVCLEQCKQGCWSLIWMVSPEMSGLSYARNPS